MGRDRKGSFTVEAAAVIPVGLALICLLLSAAFYLHDRTAVKAHICDGLQKQAFQKEADWTEEPRTLLSDADVRWTAGENAVEVSCRGSAGYISGLVRMLIPLPELSYRESGSLERLYGEDVVRAGRFQGG